MAAKPKYSYNPEPRVSANQLAELLHASPNRRRTIITNAKFPSGKFVQQYREAREALVAFLTDPARKSPNFATARAALDARAKDPSISPRKQGDAARSSEALSRVEAAYQQTGLGKLDLRPHSDGSAKMDIEGVQVSLALGCTVHGVFKGEDAVGCMTVLFNKSETSASARDARAKTAGVLAFLYSSESLTTHGLAVPKLSLAYDVFRGTLTQCPAQNATRIANLEATCEEIRLRWPMIEPPDDYDGPAV